MLDAPKSICANQFEAGIWRGVREQLAMQLFAPQSSSLTKWETQPEAMKDTYRQRAQNIMRGMTE